MHSSARRTRRRQRWAAATRFRHGRNNHHQAQHNTQISQIARMRPAQTASRNNRQNGGADRRGLVKVPATSDMYMHSSENLRYSSNAGFVKVPTTSGIVPTTSDVVPIEFRLSSDRVPIKFRFSSDNPALWLAITTKPEPPTPSDWDGQLAPRSLPPRAQCRI